MSSVSHRKLSVAYIFKRKLNTKKGQLSIHFLVQHLNFQCHYRSCVNLLKRTLNSFNEWEREWSCKNKITKKRPYLCINYTRARSSKKEGCLIRRTLISNKRRRHHIDRSEIGLTYLSTIKVANMTPRFNPFRCFFNVIH